MSILISPPYMGLPVNSQVWYTADLHFGHANIIKYCNRPFKDVDHMNVGLMERWNSLVGKNDIVWILGDFALSWTQTKKWGPLLNGFKILVPGNHDRCWKSPEKWIDQYRDEADILVANRWQRIDLPYATDRKIPNTPRILVDMSHLPRTSHDARNLKYHMPDELGLWLLCGHIHDRWRIKDRQINVGVDVWDCNPVSEEYLIALMEEMNGQFRTSN